MNIFIDTNIFLTFYSLSGGDLEELRKIAKLNLNEKVTLFFSDYLQDEFFRNRESVISKAIEEMDKSKVDLHLPNLARSYDQSVELRNCKEGFNTLLRELKANVLTDIQSNSLKADKVITEVFESASICTVPSVIIQSGILRHQLRKPPGKKDSCGDAIHWEWLLSTVSDNEDLFLVSNDGDFESPLEKGIIDRYLEKEWHEKKSSSVYLFKTLTEFLKSHFPDIKLADEIDKLSGIERFEKSSNFSSTHRAIRTLETIDDFSKDEVTRLLNAFTTNEQIHWILEDADVYGFASKVVKMACVNGLEEDSYPLQFMLSQVDPK